MKFDKWPDGWSITWGNTQFNYGDKTRTWWPYDAKVIKLPFGRSLWLV